LGKGICGFVFFGVLVLVLVIRGQERLERVFVDL
jgi:hypothetical protein